MAAGGASNLHSEPLAQNHLDNFGTSAAGLSFSLDPANAAKQMAAMQAAGRSRALSHSGPVNQSNFATPMNPANAGLGSSAGVGVTGLPSNPPSMDQQAQRAQLQHAHNMIMNAMLHSRPSNFLTQLAEVMSQRGTPLPVEMTGVPSAYDPLSSQFREITPGTNPGTFHLCGKDVDLHKLIIWVIQRGGFNKVQADAGPWESFLKGMGLERYHPAQIPGQHPLDLVSILKEHYRLLLLPFEPQWSRVVQHKVMTTMQHQQRMAMQQAIAASGGQALNPQQMGSMLANANIQAFGSMQNPAGPQQQPLQQPSQQQSIASQMHGRIPLQPGQLSQLATAQPPQQQPAAQNPPGIPQFTPNGGNLASAQRAQGFAFNSLDQPQQQNSTDSMIPNPSLDSSQTFPVSTITPDASGDGAPGAAGSDQDLDAKKRKRTDTMETEGKRPKLEDVTGDGGQDKGAQLPASSANEADPVTNQSQSPVRNASANGTVGVRLPGPSQPQPRLKIQYRPLFRQLNTYGGRNIPAIERERMLVHTRRQRRNINEWGEIDIEGLTMSLRSRINVEVSYAITTLLALSAENMSFPLAQCEDLVPVLLEVLKELAWDGDTSDEAPLVEVDAGEKPPKTRTHQELIKLAMDDGLNLFGPGLGFGSGAAAATQDTWQDGRRTADASRGPTERPASTILLIVQLLRNFSVVAQNADFLVKDAKVTDTILRLCCVSEPTAGASSSLATSQAPRPLSPALTLTDLVKLHDHALHYLANVAAHLPLDVLLPQTPARIFRLAASYLVSPSVTLPPYQTAAFPQTDRSQTQQIPMPPSTPDLVLDMFSRVSQPDRHRKIFSTSVHAEEVHGLFIALSRMLPITREDYSIMTFHSNSLEPWVGYAERIVLSMYSLVFLASPTLKRRMKRPGITHVLKRLSYFYMKCTTPDGKVFSGVNANNSYPFMVISRRAVEVLKLLDNESDPFADESATTGSTFNGPLGFPTFGIGYGEPDAMGSKAAEEGVGLLAGSWEDVVTKMMFCPGVDDEFFSEMDSLFIADIRASRVKELEEKRINKEMANIRKKFKGAFWYLSVRGTVDEPSAVRFADAGLTSTQRKKYVAKIIFTYILGYKVDVGHMEAVNLISSSKYSEKQIGYLAVTLLMHENSDFLRLVVNSIRKDLESHSEIFNCLALHAIANVGGEEMAESLAPDVHRLLISPDKDISVRRRALDLLYSMCDVDNTELIIGELLRYLKVADYGLREEMVLKIAISTEKFATSYKWYVDTILQLISTAGDHVGDEVWYRVIQIVTNTEDLQEYAAKVVFEHLKSPTCHESLIKIGGYVLGEYGHIIANSPGYSPFEQFQLLQTKANYCSPATRALLLSTYLKWINVFPEIKPNLLQVFERYCHVLDSELQQRACEYLAIASRPEEDELLQNICEEMPPFPARESTLLARLNRKQGDTEDKRTWIIGGKEANEDLEAKKNATKRKATLDTGGATASNILSDLQGLDLSAPASQQTPTSSTITPAPAGDLISDTTAAAPQPAKPSVQLTVSPNVDRWFERLTYSSEALLYEDIQLQIGYKSEYHGHLGRVALYFGNKMNTPLTSFTATIDIADSEALSVAFAKIPPSTVTPRLQTQQILNIECKNIFTTPPILRLSYLAGSLQTVNLRLPIVISKFFEPVKLAPPEFFERWKLIGGPPRESQEIFPITLVGGVVNTERQRKVIEGYTIDNDKRVGDDPGYPKPS
ncbi:hypothetical protein FRB99_006583 [Tulasnella sp. 403]|nr:hypothetical protein FRB99_006583 [Tulasnella sp. 403]